MSKKALVLSINVLIFILLLAACQSTGLTSQNGSPTTGRAHDDTGAGYLLAAIFPGVVTDADYNTLGYIGITEVERNMGIKTAYTENVNEQDVMRIMSEYIYNGYDIIWTHGGQYVEQTVEMASQYPKVTFIAEGDDPVTNPPENLWFIERNYQVGFYAIGATAALSTRTGKIGYMGGPMLPLSYAEVHAIQQAITDLGLEDKVEFEYVWVGDFNDPIKARQLADTLIADGVDFIMGSLNLGMFGVFEAVKASRSQTIMVTAKYIEKSSFAPKNYVTSLLYDFTDPLEDIVENIIAGERGGYYPLGFSTGFSIQVPFRNVDPSVELQVMELLAKIQDGTIEVIKDTSPIQ